MMKFERNIAGFVLVIMLALEIFTIRFSYYQLGIEITKGDFSIMLFLDELFVLWPGLIALLIWYICQMWVASKKPDYSPISISERLMFKPVKIRTILLTIGFAVVVSPIATLFNIISQLFVSNVVADEAADIVKLPIWLSILGIAVLPAVCEEFVFRGIIYGGYRRVCRPLPAIVMSGLLFGLMHMNFNQFSYGFIIGIFAALLVEASGSIFTSMLLHFLINLSAVLQMYEVKDIDGVMDSVAISLTWNDYGPMIIIYGVISLAAVSIAMKILKSMAKIENTEDPGRLVRFSKYYRGIGVVSAGAILSIAETLFFMFMDVIM